MRSPLNVRSGGHREPEPPNLTLVGSADAALSEQGPDRQIVLTLVSSVFVALLGVGIIVPVMPIYATDLGATGTTLGLMVAGFSISRGLLQPFVGGLSDRTDRRRFMVLGLIVYAIAGCLYPLATSVGQLIAIRTFHGVGSAMIVPMAMSYMADMAPEREEGRYMGIINVALFAGIGCGPLIGGVFLDSFGVNFAFYAMASASAVAMLMVVIWLPAGRRQGGMAAYGLLRTLQRMSGSRRVQGILLSRLSTMLVMVPTMAFLPLLMERFMDAGGFEIGLVIAMRTLTNAVLQTPFGMLADRLSRVRILVVGSFLVSFAMFAVPLASNLWHLLGIFAFLGAAEAMVWPTIGALATEEGRIYGQGSMMGIFNMAMSAGIFIGSLAAGSMVDIYGLEAAFISVGVVVILSTLVVAVLLRPRPPQMQPVVVRISPEQR